MIKKIILLSCLLAIIECRTCKYTSGDFNVHWVFSNNSIHLNFQNDKIKNNEWTAIGFGDNKNLFEAIVFVVGNNQVTAHAATTSEKAVPAIHNDINFTVESAQFYPEDETINVAMVLPTTLNGLSLTQCQKWRFIKHSKINANGLERNSNNPSDKKVCPTQCV